MGKARYAIYYVPEFESPLWRFGSRWLGHESATDDDMTRLEIKGLKHKRIEEITSAPRLYGFHATLKPPFRLAKNTDREMLDEALEAFAAGCEPFKVPALELAELDGFIALRPKEESATLHAFAADCVQAFDNLRAPMTGKELERRRHSTLTKRQEKLLKKWGYPYVMDEYRFHMTLTERLESGERKRVLRGLQTHADEVLTGKAWTFDQITLLRQKKPGDCFEVMKCYPLKKLKPNLWPAKKK